MFVLSSLFTLKKTTNNSNNGDDFLTIQFTTIDESIERTWEIKMKQVKLFRAIHQVLMRTQLQENFCTSCFSSHIYLINEPDSGVMYAWTNIYTGIVYTCRDSVTFHKHILLCASVSIQRVHGCNYASLADPGWEYLPFIASPLFGDQQGSLRELLASICAK